MARLETLKNIGNQKLEKVTLANNDLTVEFLNFGARWYKTIMSDKNGNWENIMLSMDSIDDILADQAQFGAIVGPIAGRIKNGEVGDKIHLAKNVHKQHNLHSMPNGWDQQFFITNLINDTTVEFQLKDTVSGFARELMVCVRYELKGSSVDVQIRVRSSDDTFVNPTNHSYFNLAGAAKETITASHTLWINSSTILETTPEQIPTGKLLTVANTGYDFQVETNLQQALYQTGGLDNCFVLNKLDKQIADLILRSKHSGRTLSIFTNRKCIVCFSTTNWYLPIRLNGQAMIPQMGIALEPQEHVDSSHHPEWCDISLAKDEEKNFQMKYVFTIENV